MTATCALASRLQTARLPTTCAALDFEADEVLGIFNHRLELTGLSYRPLRPDGLRTSACQCLLTPGGHRLGRRLFDAASLHARNRGIDMP